MLILMVILDFSMILRMARLFFETVRYFQHQRLAWDSICRIIVTARLEYGVVIGGTGIGETLYRLPHVDKRYR